MWIYDLVLCGVVTILLLWFGKSLWCVRETCKFFSIFNGVSLGIVLCDPNRNILCVNEEAKRLWNLPPEGVVDKGLLPESVLEDLVKRSRQGELRPSFNYRSNQRAPSLVHSQWMEAPQGACILLVLRDISQEEKSRYYQEIYLKQSGLVFLGSIFENLAHEIRTPCLAAEGCFRIIQEDFLPKIRAGNPLSNQELEELSKCLRNGSRTTSQISTLLNHSRNFRRGSRISEIGDIELTEACIYARDTIQAAYNTIIGNRISIRTCGQGPYFIRGFLNRFLEAIGNILKNSVEAIVHRSRVEPDLVPQIDISIRGEDLKGHPDIKQIITIEISDNGSGLPEQAKKYVGTSLFTTKAHDPAFKGTGLGLTMVIRTINEIGGTWEIDNRPEGGTKTTIKIPIPQRIMAD